MEHIVQPSLKVREICLDTGWDVEKLGQLLGASMATNIMEKVGGRKHGSDTLIWRPNVHGRFSTRSAWEVIRVRAPMVEWAGVGKMGVA